MYDYAQRKVFFFFFFNELSQLDDPLVSSVAIAFERCNKIHSYLQQQNYQPCVCGKNDLILVGRQSCYACRVSYAQCPERLVICSNPFARWCVGKIFSPFQLTSALEGCGREAADSGRRGSACCTFLVYTIWASLQSLRRISEKAVYYLGLRRTELRFGMKCIRCYRNLEKWA